MKHEIMHELREHIPFTALASLFAVIITAVLITKSPLLNYTINLFYIFHPAHIFFSSIVSAAIFYKYKKNIILAIISSILVSTIIGSVSDIIFPYIGALLFNIPISFNLPAIENPLLIFGIGFIGSLIGIITRYTKFPHFAHVLISLFASLLYILAYSTNFSLISYILIFIITTISVVIPCCLSDIVLPIIFKEKLRNLEKNE